MLATYSTNKIIGLVLKRYVSERRRNINQTNTNKQPNKEMLEKENTELIN